MQYRSPKLPIHGWLNIDKPYGMSSAQVVARVKKITGAKKVGHAGTLDPLAFGVLPIALGEATKTVSFMQDATKEYEFVVSFGKERDTGDAEGRVVTTSSVIPNEMDLKNVLTQFTGNITQTPPLYSAIKINGERAYTLAREGKDVEMPSRTVIISTLELVDVISSSEYRFRTSCSKGTYIRSLAQDMARAVGSCGYVSELVRTRVQNFFLKSTVSLEKLKEIVHVAPATKKNNFSFEHLLPVEAVLDDIPVLPICYESMSALMCGRSIETTSVCEGEQLAAFFEGTLIALLEKQGEVLQPVRVFNIITNK